MPNRPPGQWMTKLQAAERLGIPPDAVDRLVEAGRVEKRDRGNGRFRRTDVEAIGIVRALQRKR